MRNVKCEMRGNSSDTPDSFDESEILISASCFFFCLNFVFYLFQWDLTRFFTGLLQTEIAKRLNAIIAQILPFLSQEHQQQVATAVERAKQVTMTELNAIIGVSYIKKL